MLPALLLSLSLVGLPPGVDATLLPDLDKHTPDEIELAGLATLYPGRILHEVPHTSDPGNLNRPPLVVDIIEPPHELQYIRVYDLEASLVKLNDALTKPAVIIDLRYVAADAASAEKFAQELGKAGLDYTTVHGLGTIPEPGDVPKPDPKNIKTTTKHPPLVLVITNGLTSGPLEGWLQAFQEKDSVLTVGSPTAGQPGNYKLIDGQKDYYILTGELKPVSVSGSVVGVGVKPRFPVSISREEDYRAYFDVERGAKIDAMLRVPRLAATAQPTPLPTVGTSAKPLALLPLTPAPAPAPAAAPGEDLTDPVLQRAVDIVAALQILGRLPPWE